MHEHEPVESVTIGAGMTASILAARVLPGTSVRMVSIEQGPAHPNVFVTGSSLFPQNAGADPTGTAAALAYRTAEALRDRYFAAPEELFS